MKNIVKYFSSLFVLLLVVVFTSVNKSEGGVTAHQNSVTAFESSDYSNQSCGELTSLNYTSLSSITTSCRRITRTNKVPSQLQFCDDAALCCSSSELFVSKIRNNPSLITIKPSIEGYIYVLCCIRI